MVEDGVLVFPTREIPMPRAKERAFSWGARPRSTSPKAFLATLDNSTPSSPSHPELRRLVSPPEPSWIPNIRLGITLPAYVPRHLSPLPKHNLLRPAPTTAPSHSQQISFRYGVNPSTSSGHNASAAGSRPPISSFQPLRSISPGHADICDHRYVNLCSFPQQCSPGAAIAAARSRSPNAAATCSRLPTSSLHATRSTTPQLTSVRRQCAVNVRPVGTQRAPAHAGTAGTSSQRVHTVPRGRPYAFAACPNVVAPFPLEPVLSFPLSRRHTSLLSDIRHPRRTSLSPFTKQRLPCTATTMSPSRSLQTTPRLGHNTRATMNPHGVTSSSTTPLFGGIRHQRRSNCFPQSHARPSIPSAAPNVCQASPIGRLANARSPSPGAPATNVRYPGVKVVPPSGPPRVPPSHAGPHDFFIKRCARPVTTDSITSTDQWPAYHYGTVPPRQSAPRFECSSLMRLAESNETHADECVQMPISSFYPEQSRVNPRLSTKISPVHPQRFSVNEHSRVTCDAADRQGPNAHPSLHAAQGQDEGDQSVPECALTHLRGTPQGAAEPVIPLRCADNTASTEEHDCHSSTASTMKFPRTHGDTDVSRSGDPAQRTVGRAASVGISGHTDACVLSTSVGRTDPGWHSPYLDVPASRPEINAGDAIATASLSHGIREAGIHYARTGSSRATSVLGLTHTHTGAHGRITPLDVEAEHPCTSSSPSSVGVKSCHSRNFGDVYGDPSEESTHRAQNQALHAPHSTAHDREWYCTLSEDAMKETLYARGYDALFCFSREDLIERLCQTEKPCERIVS